MLRSQNPHVALLLAAQTDLHEDGALQGAARALPTPVLWRPVTSKEQEVGIWQSVMLSYVQKLQLHIAVATLCVVPVNYFARYVHLP